MDKRNTLEKQIGFIFLLSRSALVFSLVSCQNAVNIINSMRKLQLR